MVYIILISWWPSPLHNTTQHTLFGVYQRPVLLPYRCNILVVTFLVFPVCSLMLFHGFASCLSCPFTSKFFLFLTPPMIMNIWHHHRIKCCELSVDFLLLHSVLQPLLSLSVSLSSLQTYPRGPIFNAICWALYSCIHWQTNRQADKSTIHWSISWCHQRVVSQLLVL